MFYREISLAWLRRSLNHMLNYTMYMYHSWLGLRYHTYVYTISFPSRYTFSLDKMSKYKYIVIIFHGLLVALRLQVMKLFVQTHWTYYIDGFKDINSALSQ